MGGAELAIDNVTIKRGELPIVRDVTIACPEGQVTVLLGANGAGKTTLMDGIAGVIPVERGTIALDGQQIQRLARDRRAKRGLAYVEQGRTVFAGLTVQENLAVASHGARNTARAYELFPELEARKQVTAQMLSGGEQQMLVLARAIVSQPRVLLIDEMSQGLAPVIVKRMIPFVQTAARSGIAVLLVEQFAALALSIGAHAYVLSVGSIVLEGPCEDLLARPDDVRHAYFAGGQDTNHGHDGTSATAIPGAATPQAAQNGGTL
ncbi:MAG TPA: ABC transporter ATP-binding protein [Streptosporangiaceae bacterium]|nr:ABC transporter ATP-binding protein [Streptosporangiaceae bacterium]